MDAKAWPALLYLSLLSVTASNACAEPPDSSPAVSGVVSRSPAMGTGVFRGRVVQFENVDGWAVVEGDIVLGRAEELARALAEIGSAAPAAKSLSVDNAANLWPKGAGDAFEVPYTIDADPNGVVPDAVNAFNSTFAGFIQFIPRTAQADYVAFALNLPSTAVSCNANLGRVGGKQNIIGPPNCSAGSLLHEMGHAIGLQHEQSRADRDQYVTYQSQNSAKYLRSASRIAPTNRQPLTPYDYGSLMHYDDFTFTRNGLPTHVTIPQGIGIGLRVGFSAADIDGVHRLYGATPAAVTVTSNPAGLQVVVDGEAFTTPRTFSWPLDSVHQIDVVQPGQLLNGASFGFARWNVDLVGDGAASRTIAVVPGSGSAGNPAQAPAVTVYTANFIRLFPVIVTASGDTAAADAATTASVIPPPQPFPGLTGTFLRNNQLVTFVAQVQPGFAFGGWFYDFLGFVTGGPATASWLVHMPGAQSPAPGLTVDARGVANPLLRIRGRGSDGVVDGFAIKVNGVARTTPYSSIYTVFDRTGANQIEAVSPLVTDVATTRYRFRDWDGAAANPISVTLPAAGQPSREITANFDAEYLVTITPASSCRGTVAITPASADGYHAFGQALDVTATPASGWSFAGWTDDLAGAGAQASVIVTGEVFAVPRFNLVAEPLAISGASRLFAVVGEAAFDLLIYGTGFTTSTRVIVNGVLRASAAYVDANRMRVPLAAADFANPGEILLSASNVDTALCAVVASASVPVRAAGFTLPATTDVVEFYHGGLDHYFITANVDEMAKLDNGTFKGWSRTGRQFKGFLADSAALVLDIARTVCRFYGNPAAGLDSHFYSGAADECDEVKQKFPDAWVFESSDVFQAVLPDRTTGACPDGTVAVYRLFNQRADANHRYTTELAVRNEMMAKGYGPEGYGPLGVALCSPA